MNDSYFPPPWNVYEFPEKTEGWIEFQKAMHQDPKYYLEGVMKEGGVNWTAAENFLGTMDVTMAKGDHIMNAKKDAISYGWNKATLDYIIRGIERAYVHGKV